MHVGLHLQIHQDVLLILNTLNLGFGAVLAPTATCQNL